MKREARWRVSTAPKAKPSQAPCWWSSRSISLKDVYWHAIRTGSGLPINLPGRTGSASSTCLLNCCTVMPFVPARNPPCICLRSRTVIPFILARNTGFRTGSTWLGFRRRTDTGPRLSLHPHPAGINPGDWLWNKQPKLVSLCFHRAHFIKVKLKV
jgi:hypothetical protein